MVFNRIFSIAVFVAILGISSSIVLPDDATQAAQLSRATKSCEGNRVCETAMQAYIYGYPLMLMEYTKQALLRQPGSQLNRFVHKRSRPDPSDINVVRPNEDTLYSVAFLDLSDGPQILKVPDVQNRFFLLQLLDGWSTSIAGSPGTANTGSRAQSFAIVGPNFKGTVRGVSRIYRLRTNMVWVLGRTHIKQGKQDYAEVAKTQQGYCLLPLADFQRGDRSNCKRSVSVDDKGKGPMGLVQPGISSPPDIVENIQMDRFLKELAELMTDNPAYAADNPLLTKFKDVLGFVPGESYSPSPVLSAAIRPAREAALNSMRKYAEQGFGQYKSGWNLILRDIGEYGDDYLRRAAVALVGFGANLPEDSIYPAALADKRDQPLRGGNRYRLRFGHNNFPPVNTRFDGFWSVSLYDEKGYFIENDQQRYAVHSWELESDTSHDLNIYIGCEDRAAFHDDGITGQDFWLPAATPDGIALTLRMYAPESEALLGSRRGAKDKLPAWTPPAIEWLGSCRVA